MKTHSLICVALVLGAGALSFGAAEAKADVRVGVSINTRGPRGATEVHVGPDRYYTHRGVFYRPGPHGRYVVVRAPRGARIYNLPPHYARIYVGNVVYYRYDNVYYQDFAGGGYVVVDPPVTVVTPAPVVQTATAPVAMPATPAPVVEETQSVWVGSTEYAFKDGQFFQKTADGLVWTEAPLGAVAKSLPGDATSVWYQNLEYFECDDVYFQKQPQGYVVVTAPWKK